MGEKSTYDANWYHRIPTPVKGIPDEKFHWGKDNNAKTSQFMSCWGARWNLIKHLNSKHINNRTHIVKLLRNYAGEYNSFLKTAWNSPPKQSRETPFVWGHLVSHSLLFEKIMISNALISALIPDEKWTEIQNICRQTITDLSNWKNLKLRDVTLTTPYYQSIHSYAGYRMCLPKLNESLKNYPNIDFKASLRVGVHTLKFLNESRNIYTLSANNTWKNDYPYLQKINWHLASLQSLNPKQSDRDTSLHAMEFKPNQLQSLYYDEVNVDSLDLSGYILSTYSGDDQAVAYPDRMLGYEHIQHFCDEFVNQKEYVGDLCLRYPDHLPKVEHQEMYETQIKTLLESIDIVKSS